MSQFFVYLFWPNPANAMYDSPKAIVLTSVCALMILGSFALKRWRKKMSNAPTKKLTRSWPSASLWFGLIGLFLVVCRVEGISFVSMRVWWLIWLAILIAYSFIQWKMFKARHYEIVPKQKKDASARDKYLPKKKK